MQTPSNITLNKAKNLLTLTFGDTEYPLTAEYLRVHSPSAEVVGHGPGQETLQIGKENVTIKRIEPTGNYAIVLFFSDGHDSGIYSWEHLHNLATEYEVRWSNYLTRLKDAGHSHKQH
ncbi:COG3536: Uncharacterized protein conserved in bacteria [Bathymodiolus thermophilus thioautotrophic gill symbiont]|uniref:gamma-butyrobetaine hydroxylase-like domain-containing protein n=1 Tax=Bathymodiolus thermophilus thioautotrophic gill symbiont TaxID=2360 RepID=UPI0010B85F07|nr:DUF971 domain-containing protein [Bathymodiolus thermophilus thioautotrophic gill symbiont]SGZ85031.1 COG3536: Uncharacterized protein conserved in bacteria [Bathymodiolus thermophilus thioautotrophic gill symbiont]